MATGNSLKKPCCKCDKDRRTLTCDGCHRSFCFTHVDEHRQELAQEMDNIGQQHDILQRDLREENVSKTLSAQIDRWERKSIEKIQVAAAIARDDLKKLTNDSLDLLSQTMNKLTVELKSSRENNEYTEIDLDRWTKQLQELRKEYEKSLSIELSKDSSFVFHLLKVQRSNKRETNETNPGLENIHGLGKKQTVPVSPGVLARVSSIFRHKPELSAETNASFSPFSSSEYLCLTFGINQHTDSQIITLFEQLMRLQPMDINGSMNGRCKSQIDQMKQFLLQKSSADLHQMYPETVVYFPNDSSKTFAMTAREIINWQHSYVVYADESIDGMDKKHLNRSLCPYDRLTGYSSPRCAGRERFLMKFVVRVSTCPILMEFDAKIIPRTLNEEWPHRIKLVSATNINLAGRNYDVYDIPYYITNWRDIFDTLHLNPSRGMPDNESCYPKRNAPKTKLNKERVEDSLMRMTRLRLRACDKEGVQIVVETDTVAGASAGDYLGIDGKIRGLSRKVIRIVLEQDGPSYKNIRAIVFALPIMNRNRSHIDSRSTFDDFVDEFSNPKYNGSIPVLIADQDMHRLTVTIARHGFIVSESNYTDSHGGFGHRWECQESGLEQKVALTTVGLLVQQYPNNLEISNRDNYHLLDISNKRILQWKKS